MMSGVEATEIRMHRGLPIVLGGAALVVVAAGFAGLFGTT